MPRDKSDRPELVTGPRKRILTEKAKEAAQSTKRARPLLKDSRPRPMPTDPTDDLVSSVGKLTSILLALKIVMLHVS
jgi:hypothetical protein